jgi:hypothetical protein
MQAGVVYLHRLRPQRTERDVNDEEFKTALLGAAGEDWIDGFKAGWQSSGEGYNGEWPDEGRTWEESVGLEAMLRVLETRVRGGF